MQGQSCQEIQVQTAYWHVCAQLHCSCAYWRNTQHLTLLFLSRTSRHSFAACTDLHIMRIHPVGDNTKQVFRPAVLSCNAADSTWLLLPLARAAFIAFDAAALWRSCATRCRAACPLTAACSLTTACMRTALPGLSSQALQANCMQPVQANTSVSQLPAECGFVKACQLGSTVKHTRFWLGALNDAMFGRSVLSVNCKGCHAMHDMTHGRVGAPSYHA